MTQGWVRGEDVRAVLRLVGEARELVDAGARAAEHFLSGLSRLLGAPVAVAIDGEVRPDGAPRFTDVVDHAWGERALDAARRYYETRAMESDPLLAAAAKARRGRFTVARSDTMSAARWHDSDLFNVLHRPLGVDDSLLSFEWLGGAPDLRVLAFKRARGDAPFAARERDLLDMVAGECRWMFARARDVRSPLDAPALSPRERQTLELLLTGASEKEIAARLGVSPYTTHDYVKSVYRKLGVSKRAELMARALPPR